MKKVSLVLVALIMVAAASPAPKGRIVVFGDKKTGALKTDVSIKVGTLDDLKNLKLVETEKGVHACFVGNKESIKPLVESMITSANKTEGQDELTIKNFEVSKGSLINLEVMSRDAKPYLHLNIGPC